MNRSIFWRLVWKEYRLQRALWIAIVVLTLLLQGIMVWTVTDATERVYCLFGSALVLTACYALGCGAVLFAAERETGTFEFQRAIPVSSARVFAAKVTYALASTLALILVLVFAAAVFSRWQAPDAATYAGLWAAFGLGACEVLAWGIFFSLRSARPLLAAILAVSVASTVVHFIGWSIAPNEVSMRYGPTVPYRLVVLALLALADFWLGLRWLGASREVSLGDRLAWRSPKPRARAVQGPVPLPPSRDMLLSRLVWQQWRQSRGMIAVVGVLAVVFAATGNWFHSAYASWWRFGWLQIGAILAALLAALMGSCVFLGDQSRQRFRFFADHAARPGYVWLSRQLIWLAALAVWIVAAAVLLAVSGGEELMWLLRSGWRGDWRGEFDWGLLFSAPWGLVNLIAWMFLAYSAGQLCSLLFRSGILAAVFGIMLGAALCGWAWLMAFLDINRLWSVWPIPLLLLLATRLRIGDWILQRNRLGGWLRIGLVVVLPAAAIIAAIPGARLSAVPLPRDGSPAPYPVRDWTEEERATEALYERACRLYQDPRRFMPEEQQKTSDWSWPRPDAPPTAWELAWLKANRECLALTLDATRRPVSDDPRPIKGQYRRGGYPNYWELPRLLRGAARVAQVEGRLDEAMEYYLAAFRVSRHEAVYYAGHLGLGDFFYNDLCAWVARPGQTSQRVATMLREVTKVTDHPPSRALEISAEYQFVRDLIDGDPTALGRFDMDPKDMVVIALWNRWLPWERERALRLLARLTDWRLDNCLALEGWAARGEAIHARRERARLFLDRAARPWPKALALNEHLSPWYLWPGGDWGQPEAVIVRAETSRRVVRLMLAIEAWRLEKGRFPESLDFLVVPYLDRMPVDPSTGLAFGYFPEGFPFPVKRYWGDQNPIPAKTPLLTGSEVQVSRGYPFGEAWRRTSRSEEDAKVEPEPTRTWFAKEVFLLPVPQEKASAGGSSAPHK